MIAKLSLAVLITSAVWTGSAAAAYYMFPDKDNEPAQGIYQCQILDDIGLGNDGELQKGKPLNQWFREHYRTFTFNAADGSFVTPSEPTTHWVILRAGTSEWDLIANLPSQDPAFNVMRIEVWNKPIGFTLSDGKDLFSGTCIRTDE